MGNQADFYGQQANAYGQSADSRQAKISSGSQMQSQPQASTSTSPMGEGQGQTGADAVGDAGMQSGNPYAMAIGTVMKVAAAGQKREQAKMNATRQAFIDRQDRMRQATDKLLAMDYGV